MPCDYINLFDALIIKRQSHYTNILWLLQNRLFSQIIVKKTTDLFNIAIIFLRHQFD